MSERITDEELQELEDWGTSPNPSTTRLVVKEIRTLRAEYDGLLTRWAESRARHLAAEARALALEAALKPFADAHFYYNDAGKPDDCATGIGGVTYGDFRRAVSVLAPPPPPSERSGDGKGE